MLRRFSGLCFALALLILLNCAIPMILVSAQDASPVAIEPVPDAPDPSIESFDESENESVAPADATGNTPAGNSPSNPIYALVPSVYLYFPRVTTTGESIATEGILSDPNSFVPAYRTDNARLFEVSTTAEYDPNIKLCIYFGSAQFADPYSADLFRFDGAGWTIMPSLRESDTICGYTATLGMFVVAEPGTNPTPEPVATDTPAPTDTTTPVPTDTPIPTATPTAANTTTPVPTETPTVTVTASHTEPPVPTETPPSSPTPTATHSATPTATATPSNTSTSTAVPTETPSHTPTETPLPTDTATPSMTASTTPTDTATASVTNSPTLLPTETATDIPTPVPSDTPIPTNTPTTTSSPSVSSTSTPSVTLIPTETPSETGTPTPLPTDTPSATATITSTATLSPTPIPSHTATQQPSEIPSATATETPSPIPSEMPTLTATPTAATGQTQFALPNVWVIYSEPPSSGTTQGTVLDGNTLPAIPSGHRAETAWFFSVSTTVSLTTSKQLCVLFSARDFVDPVSTVLFLHQSASWTPLSGQVLADLDSTQGTICGYTPSLGDFALAERLPATTTPTASPSPTATSSLTPSNTATASRTATSTPTTSPSSTPSPSATATLTNSPTLTTTPSPSPTVTLTATATSTSSPTATASSTLSSTLTSTPTSTATPSPSSTPTSSPSSTPSATPTATLEPGSYRAGTTLSATTRVNLRAAATTNSASRGVVARGALVTVTGASIFSGGRYWVPISTTDLGSGWIAGDYLISLATPSLTATAVSTPPTITPTPGGQQPTRTATRSPGGFIAGDFVRTTTRLNLRSRPSTSSQVLTVLLANATGQITGNGVRNGSNTFYPVLFDGRPAGYVAGKYLQLTTAPPDPTRTVSPTPTFAGVPIRFTTSNVNMRSGPGTGNRIVATLPKGTRVNITGIPRRSGGYDWYPVAVYGIGPGWIADKFLSIDGPI